MRRPLVARRLSAGLVVAASLAAAHGARAADRPSVAVTRAQGPIRVDGVLDEPDWSRATPISNFRLLFAREGQVPSESTTVRLLLEDDAVVIGVRCQSQVPPHASLAPRDQITDGDFIAIHFDPDGDGRRAYIFGINPYGVQVDGLLTDAPDFTWDGVWEGEARRDAAGWTAELRIPFVTMRFRAGSRGPWRLWIRRELTARNEIASWPLWKQGEAGNIMLQAADLTGMEGVRGGHDWFAEPYAFGALDGERTYDPARLLSPWSDAHRREAGLDVQAGLGSALALNATWNPDFSQIESDALLIDLNQRFPLQYPEKRPFFLEGSDVFVSPLEIVYTRRMADPRWGVKLAGHTGGTRTGALFLRDDGGASLAGSGFGSDDLARPGTFGLGRAERNLGEGRSVGILAGLHTQDGNARSGTYAAFGDPVAWDGARNAFVAGDATLKLSERWSWTGQAGWTMTRVDTFHAGLGSDESRRDAGGIWTSRVQYSARARSVDLGVRGVDPRFRDELGYQQRVGVRYETLATEQHWDLAGGPLQRVNGNTNTAVIHDLGGGLEYSEINPWVEFDFRRNLYVAPGVHVVDEAWLGRHYHQVWGHLTLQDLRWQPLTWTLESVFGSGIYYGDTTSSFLGWTETTTGTVTMRPAPWITAAGSVKHLRVARHAASGDVIRLWLYGLNTTAQFTRRLSARLYPQYDSDAQHLAVNALLSYVVSPGTVFYLGSNAGYDQLPGVARPHLTSRQLFAKASYRLQR